MKRAYNEDSLSALSCPSVSRFLLVNQCYLPEIQYIYAPFSYRNNSIISILVCNLIFSFSNISWKILSLCKEVPHFNFFNNVCISLHRQAIIHLKLVSYQWEFRLLQSFAITNNETMSNF